MKQTMLVISLASIMSSPVVFAQASQGVAPITLQVSLGPEDVTAPKNVAILRVKITNVSDHEFDQPFCKAIGGLYELEVRFNGASVPESAEHRKERLSREAHGCMDRLRELDAGESRTDNVYYKVAAAGTYEFTVLQETTPNDPGKNLTVRSNTLTVVVPSSGDTKPN